MTCSAPINVSNDGSSGKCQLKCDYSFDYSDSVTTVTNNGDHVSLTYDESSVPPVKYNAKDYQVREVRLYTPSLHSYNGQKAPAEMLIMHSSGGSKLIVSVPIVESSSKTKTTRFLTTMADYVQNFVRNVGSSASMGNTTWNLNEFIPEKKFFSYKASAPFLPCNSGYDYVVFSTDDQAQATISRDALANIKKYIRSSNRSLATNTPFYKSEGPARAGLDSVSDDIYISCQPVGESEEQTIVKNGAQPEFVDDFKSLFKKGGVLDNPVFQVLAGVTVMFGVFKLGSLVFGKKKVSGAVSASGASAN